MGWAGVSTERCLSVLFSLSPPQLNSGTFIPKCLRKKLLPFPLQIQVRHVVGAQGAGGGERGLTFPVPPIPTPIPPPLLVSLSPGLCSEACLFRLAHCPSPKLLRARSAEKRRPVPTFQKVPLPSGPAPAHSLGDLKGSWPGRGLVARFLQMSRKAPDPNGNGTHGHKQVELGELGQHPGKPRAAGQAILMLSPAAPSRCPGARGAGQAERASTFAAAVT